MTGGELTPDELQLRYHDVECVTYDERFGIAYDRRTARAAAAEVARLLPRRRFARVLDVGCGTGYLGLGLAASGRATTVHSTDLSPGMLGRARVNAERLGVEPRLVQSAATALPYRDGSFDAVVSRGVLHHLHDPVAALSEWRRVVVPGGPVVATSEPTPAADRVGGAVAVAVERLAHRTRRLVGRVAAHDDPDAVTRRYWDLVAMAVNLHTFTADDLRTLAAKSGFARVDVLPAGLVSIAMLAAYHVIAGELPGLAARRPVKHTAERIFEALRAVDRVVTDRVLPSGRLLTVQAVFSG